MRSHLQQRMRREPQIVVGREVQHRLAVQENLAPAATPPLLQLATQLRLLQGGELLVDQALRVGMGARGRERAVRLFGREAIVDRYEALYRTVL